MERIIADLAFQVGNHIYHYIKSNPKGLELDEMLDMAVDSIDGMTPEMEVRVRAQLVRGFMEAQNMGRAIDSFTQLMAAGGKPN